MIIVNRIIDSIRMDKLDPPILIYGRRKTGKTFFAKNYFKNSYYFFVRRDRSIYFEERDAAITYDELIRLIEEVEDKTLIIDEFHRLPGEFLDWLHIKSPSNLVMVTSTLNLARNLLSRKSPILGLFLEFKMDLIDERDILLTLKDEIRDSKRLIEESIYLREPILLRWFGRSIDITLRNLKMLVPALIGEIFEEEERDLSSRYEGIIRALSSGRSTLSDVVSFLYSYRLIDKQDISSIKPYVRSLIDIGLVKRYPEYLGKRYYYFITSPMMDLYYYLDEKYNFSEVDLNRKYFIEKIPFHVEDFFRNLLSKIFEMRVFMINKPDLQIDLVFGDFKKLKIIGEVKWKKNIYRKEIKILEEKLGRFKECRKLLVVPSIDYLEYIPEDIEVWDVNRILQEVKKNINIIYDNF